MAVMEALTIDTIRSADEGSPLGNVGRKYVGVARGGTVANFSGKVGPLGGLLGTECKILGPTAIAMVRGIILSNLILKVNPVSLPSL